MLPQMSISQHYARRLLAPTMLQEDPSNRSDLSDLKILACETPGNLIMPNALTLTGFY